MGVGGRRFTQSEPGTYGEVGVGVEGVDLSPLFSVVAGGFGVLWVPGSSTLLKQVSSGTGNFYFEEAGATVQYTSFGSSDHR